jgi:hypothetical protein
MSEAIILEFAGVGAAEYNAVNVLLGIDPVTGEGDWPAGMISHTGAVGAAGNLVVFEVWDSQASQGAFMASKLGPALGQAGVPAPVRVEWFSTTGYHHTH